MTESPDDLIPARRAAKILGCVPQTIDNYRQQGLLRCWVRAGRQYLYSERDVRAMLEPYRPGGADVPAPPLTRAEAERQVAGALDELRDAGVAV